jgi:hypothetical protein
LDDLIMGLVGVKPAYSKAILKETEEEVLFLIGRDIGGVTTRAA